MSGQTIDNRGVTLGQQTNINVTVNVECDSSPPTTQLSPPKYEGPGGVPITPVANFAGRVAELEQLKQALERRETVCVVATGIGGIGKTSLVRQFVAIRGAVCFPDGSAWLDATRLTEDLDRICRRFGWVDQREISPEEAVVFLARTLSEQRFLLVVDNLNADVPVNHVPRPGDRCRTLVTSRERALHDDLDAVRLQLEVWSVAESLGYLHSRCERLQVEEDGELVPLVEFVGRLPLGVKLLASFLLKRVTLGPVDALATLRTQPVEVLEKYRGQNPGLVATFQSSYDDLDERQRRVLQALSVCARQTRAEVVGAVVGVEEIGEVLEDLHGRSLVEHDENAKAPWRLHDVVRMFVAAQPGCEELEAAHTNWVRAHLKANSKVTAYQEFGAGVDEARWAFARLLKSDHAAAYAVYRPLERHLTTVGRYLEARELSESLLKSAHADSELSAAAMNSLGACYQKLGDIPQAIHFHRSALAFAKELGNLNGMASEFGNLGICYLTQGDVPKAIGLHERALAIAEELRNLRSQAIQLGNLGNCYQTQGDIPRAIDFHTRSLAIDVKLGRLEGIAAQLGNLGLCHRRVGDIAKAIGFLERALAVEEKLGSLEGQANQLANLGNCYGRLGDTPKAIEFLERALAIHENIGSLEGQANQLANLGSCYGTLGDTPKAIEYFERSLAIDQKLGRLEAQATQLSNLGLCYKIQGNPLKAVEFLERGLAIDQKLGYAEGEAHALGNLGLCYRTLGDISKALSFHERALGIHEKISSLEGQARDLANLGFIAAKHGTAERARGYLAHALELYRCMGLPEDHPDVAAASMVLARLGVANGMHSP